MTALEQLLRDILARWSIDPSDVIGHSDMAPDRKSDPGPAFDWARLARQGLAGPTSHPEPASSFKEAARAAGFTADVDAATLLRATRLRFAPWRRGPETGQDMILTYTHSLL
jgi:N-acetylmuramoyl-L-alanine amidase